MRNLYAIFAKFLNICKQMAGNVVNEHGNIPRRGVVPKLSDSEIIALSLSSEAIGIDSESFLFSKLQEYRREIPNLVSRRQYNDRRKYTYSLCKVIRERMVQRLDGCEDYIQGVIKTLFKNLYKHTNYFDCGKARIIYQYNR